MVLITTKETTTKEGRDSMKTLSDGSPSTLKNYKAIAELLFPGAVPYLQDKIDEQGEAAEVPADETQMLQLLFSLDQGA